MAINTGEKVKCRWCGSENVKLEDVWEEPQYGLEGEGGGTGYIYMGTDVKKRYKCNNCGNSSVIFEIKD